MSDIACPNSLQAYMDSLTPAQRAENERWAFDRLTEMRALDRDCDRLTASFLATR